MSFDDNKLSEATLKKCPKFIEFNKKCITDLSNRYSKHNKHRTECIITCINETLLELFGLYNIKSSIPIFVEKEDIFYSSMNEMNYYINKTPTVSPEKCKKPILTYQQFTRIAINKQDQNAWKISGKYFFSPYIELFIKFIQNIINKIKTNEKEKIFELSCIIFAVKLLTKTVKFDRAKEKPLIRVRTLVNSSSLHYAFKKLNLKLNVPKFYSIEKAKRKKIKKKIISKEFHNNICEYAKYLLNIIKKDSKNDINNYNFPYDWINDDIDEEMSEIISDSDNDNDNDTDNDTDNDNDKKTNIDNNRIFQFQNTSNFNNIYNNTGINKGLLIIDANFKKNRNRKIQQEIHINEMRNNMNNMPIFNFNNNIPPNIPNIPIIPFNELNNELVFDIQPTIINRIGSENIINGSMHTNDMGYSFI